MTIRHFVNGQVCAAVDSEDRGLAYGDGVFTSIAVQHQKPCLWDLHHRRLQRDCRKLGIAFTAWEKLRREVFALASRHASACVKVIITRGSGKRGYRSASGAETNPTRVVTLYPQTLSLFLDQRPPAHVAVCRHRLSYAPALAGVKHLNRLDQVLARREWGDEYQEGLMLDYSNAVIEGTMGNVFVWRENSLLTPLLKDCGVAGVMRQYVLHQAALQGVPWAEKTLNLDDFYHADGAFLCNALIGLWPIGKIFERSLPMSKSLAGFIEQVMKSLYAESKKAQ